MVFKKLLIILALLLPITAFAQMTTQQGGTGTTSPSGILYGDGTLHLKTVNVGSNLTFSGGTLSASGGGSSSFGTTSLTAIWPILYTVSSSLAQLSFGGLGTSSAISAGSGLLYATGVNTLASVSTSSPISMSITGNSGTVTNGVYTTTFNGLFDNRLSATTSLPNIITLAGLSLPYSQLTGTPTVYGYPFPSNATTTVLTFSNGATVGNSLTLSGITGSTQCLEVSTSGVVSGTGGACGSGSGAVNSVTGTTNQITSSPTTGSVVLSIPSLFSIQQASTTLFSSLGPMYVGTTSTTTIWGNATSSFTGGINLTSGCLTYNGGTCITTSSGGGTGTVSTSTHESAGQLSYWTSNSGTPALLGEVSTSTLSASSPLTGSFTQIGSGGSLGCQTASGSQAGCLSSADWTTFNNKGSGSVTSVATNNGLTGGTITTSGTIGLASISQGILGNNGAASAVPTSISTTTLYSGTAGQVLSFINGGWTGVATTTFNSPLTYSNGSVSCASCLTGNQTITLSGVITGSGSTAITTSFGSQTAGVLGSVVTGNTVVLATSTLFGTGTGGQLLTWNNGVPQWVASTTYANGTGISTAFSGNTLTITNTGVTSIVAGTNVTISGATGAVTINSTASGSGSPYPFFVTGNATTSLTQFNGGLTAYSTSTIGNGTQTNGLTITGGATTTGTSTIFGNLVAGFNYGTSTPFAISGVVKGTLSDGIGHCAFYTGDVNYANSASITYCEKPGASSGASANLGFNTFINQSGASEVINVLSNGWTWKIDDRDDGGSNNTPMSFHEININGNDTETFTILANGLIGINNPSTSAYLSIIGNGVAPEFETASSSAANSSTPNFEIDTNGHQITSGPKPSVTGGTSSVVGNDRNGTITIVGTALTSVTLTFAKAYATAPDCTESDNSTALTADITSISTTQVVFGFSVGVSSGTLWYQCIQHQ